MTNATENFLAAEAALLAHYDVSATRRRLRLADPDLDVGLLETGSGEPLVLIHGSGMSAPTWAPLLARLSGRRVLAVDLPGFGLSDPHDYRGRSLREHAVAQVSSLLDALELERAELAGNSLGGMWSLCMAQAAPERVAGVTAYGIPAVCLPGMRANVFFKLATMPGLGRLILRLPTPKDTRKAIADVLGADAARDLPDAYFDVVRATMGMPGFQLAMWSHLNLAFTRGRQRLENTFSDDELRGLDVPVHFVMGAGDVYGGPEIAERAAELMPDATVEVVPGGHAPFLDTPERVGL
jgi:pimeloyl-ACP methyl ester carboxylesterase